ncbi:MAG: DNA/RNA nuclease SfsA [Oscillospiraceae bacterium]|nr:DNA/RNA nuclease SfsA [Oscillospiraceae bacterium]
MRYNNIVPGRFIDRPNRFIAHVEIEGREQIVHVKNTGRCRELLTPGAAVYLEGNNDPNRRTAWDLVAVEKGSRLINMDSQAPNKVFGEWARGGGFLPDTTLVRPEVRFGDSRFDFYVQADGKRHFIEVKGVTLEQNGAASFPDAPTLRGVKHLEELIRAREQGYECWVCFVIQMTGIKWLEPNDVTHPAFGEALRRAARAGVHVIAMDCAVTPDSMTIQAPVPVKLGD